MRKKALLSALCFAIIAFTLGCEGMGENTKKGAVLGTLIGAGTGAVIGHQSGHAGEGAAIGGAVGAVSGGLIGSGMDKNSQAVNVEKLSLSDIILLSKNGIADEVIINKINNSGSVFNLSSQEIGLLKKEGVSDAVIDAMLATNR